MAHCQVICICSRSCHRHVPAGTGKERSTLLFFFYYYFFSFSIERRRPLFICEGWKEKRERERERDVPVIRMRGRNLPPWSHPAFSWWKDVRWGSIQCSSNYMQRRTKLPMYPARIYIRNRAIRLRNVQTISGNALADVESVLNVRNDDSFDIIWRNEILCKINLIISFPHANNRINSNFHHLKKYIQF